ncbi:MAG: hypothetical protein V7637_6371 [Mycobacteriales bacterium]
MTETGSGVPPWRVRHAGPAPDNPPEEAWPGPGGDATDADDPDAWARTYRRRAAGAAPGSGAPYQRRPTADPSGDARLLPPVQPDGGRDPRPPQRPVPDDLGPDRRPAAARQRPVQPDPPNGAAGYQRQPVRDDRGMPADPRAAQQRPDHQPGQPDGRGYPQRPAPVDTGADPWAGRPRRPAAPPEPDDGYRRRPVPTDLFADSGSRQPPAAPPGPAEAYGREPRRSTRDEPYQRPPGPGGPAQPAGPAQPGGPVTAAGGQSASAPYQRRPPSADPVADAWTSGGYQRQPAPGPPTPGVAGPGVPGLPGAGERAGAGQVAARPPTAPNPPRSRPPDPDAETAAARQYGRGATLGFGRGGGRERELVRQASAPITGSRRVVVLSIKGGVGKTTTVAVVGSLLAALRRDRVVALDASSDWGTLAARLSVVPKQTVRELAARGRHAVSEHGILAQMVASPSGLYVVGSDPQSMVSAALGEEEYLQAVRLLEYVANLMIVDVGAGLQQPFLLASLRSCDQLVVATAATWDSAQSAGAALDWLSAHGFAGLVERSIVVMNSLSPTRRRHRGYVNELHIDLARRCRVVHEIPFDPGLQPGGRILLRKIDADTRMAFLEVASDVVSGALSPPPAGGLRTAPSRPPRPDYPERGRHS